MLVVFPPIFVADTKIIHGYNFVAPLITYSATESFGNFDSSPEATARGVLWKKVFLEI